MYVRHPLIAQIYVSGAVLGFAASFVPLYSPKQPGDVYQTMSMWTAIPDSGSSLGVLGVCLVLGLVALALLASRPRPQTPFSSVGVLVVALVGTLMLLTRVGEGSNPPSLGAGAGLLLGTTIALIVTAATDLWLLLGVAPPKP